MLFRSTLDINLGPSVQTHRTAGFNFEKGRTRSLQPLPITKDRFSHITITLIPLPQHPAPVMSRQTMEGPAMSPSHSPTLELGCRTMPRALVPAAWSGDRKNGQERQASTKVSIALRPRSTAISLRLERAEVRPSLGRRSRSSFVSV